MRDERSRLLKLDLREGLLLCFPGKFLSSNAYMLIVGNRVALVDCGMPWTAKAMIRYMDGNCLKLEYVLLTHGHFDHVMGLNRLRKKTEAKIVAHAKGKLGDIRMDDGEIMNVFDNKLIFLMTYTGVHRGDHVWYYEKNNKILFIGNHLVDTANLRELMGKYGAEPKIILPGHGEPVFL